MTERHWSQTVWFRFSVIVASLGFLIVVLGCLAFLNWEWLISTEPDLKGQTVESPSAVASNGETLRNVALIIGGLVALVFAFGARGLRRIKPPRPNGKLVRHWDKSKLRKAKLLPRSTIS